MKARKIDIKSAEYPDSLKNLFNPPAELFVSGDILPSDSNAVAIVGTRKATHYGLEQSRKLSCELAVRGITVVSGMARGIDTAAHRGALEAGGRTIAVMGSGHNHIYPPENKKLYDEITKHGAVVSEFPPDTPPRKENFPRRNRIISGMSKGVVVVEAPERSGALITVNFALEQGREVFAMPGNISSTKSSGTNKLIKEGAKLVEGIQDILDELEHVLDIKEVSAEGQGLGAPAAAGSSRATVLSAPQDMPAAEKAIFNILDENPKTIDEISELANFPAPRVSDILLKLELKRLARALPGENFVRS